MTDKEIVDKLTELTELCRFLTNYMDVLEQDANYSSIKTELKPCPFCGSKAEITRRNHDNDGYSIHVGCSKCFCKITKNLWFDFNKSTIQYNIDIMTKKWNTRVEMEVQDDK